MTEKTASAIARDLSLTNDDLRFVIYGPETDIERDEDSIWDHTVWTDVVSLPPSHEIVATWIGGRRLG